MPLSPPLQHPPSQAHRSTVRALCGLCRSAVLTAFLLLAFALPAATALAAPSVDTSIPGGNAVVRDAGAGTFFIAPDLRDTKGWWFHYHFRVCGTPGDRATIVFAENCPMGARGPAMSRDGGRTWTWLGRETLRRFTHEGKQAWSFETTVPADGGELRYAFAPTYLEAHLHDWLAKHRGHPSLQVAELCRSRNGRVVELLRAGCLEESKTRGIVLLSSRHHACESIATYALEGLLDAVLADDALGRRWRERWQIVAMPFADKDGVEDGDQGKNRQPHDHNRDYNAAPLYPEVAAWMKLGDSLRERVVLSLDLHCPYISGAWNDRVYLVGSPAPTQAANERLFAEILERVRTGPIPFRAADCYLPSGQAWNKAANYAAGRSNAAWARDTFPSARLAATIEITYADAFGVEMNATAARALGRDLAHALIERLER